MIKLKKSLAVSDTGFVFDPATGESYMLNATGMEIISLLKEGKDLKSITAIITQKYDVQPNIFERYYFDFAGMLKQMQLVASDE